MNDVHDPSWAPATVEQSLESLHALSGLLEKACTENPLSDDVFHLSNWLIVRSCGHLETTEKACIGNLFNLLYGSAVYDYLTETSFSRGRNPNPDTLSDLLKKVVGRQRRDSPEALHRRFASFMSSEFDEACYEEFANRSYRDCLKVVVESRNSLVHGVGAGRPWKMALDSAVIAERVGEWYIREFSPNGHAHSLLGGSKLEDLSSECA